MNVGISVRRRQCGWHVSRLVNREEGTPLGFLPAGTRLVQDGVVYLTVAVQTVTEIVDGDSDCTSGFESAY